MTLCTDVPAQAFAQAWQIAAIARSDDAARPVLHKTIHAEVRWPFPDNDEVVGAPGQPAGTGSR
jgi:hypothetical protein